MASPQLQVFFLYDPTTHAPITGQSIAFIGGIHFLTYKNDLGVNLGQPTIVELGGGAYGFVPVFTAGRGIFYIVDCGPGVAPDRVALYIRPEDYYVDNVDVLSSDIQGDIATVAADVMSDLANSERLLDHAEGKWQIFVSGPNANTLIVYDRLGSLLKQFNLKDKSGAPSPVNPYQKIPV